MKLPSLGLFGDGPGAQNVDLPLTALERQFIENTAFPLLDRTADERALEKLAESLWNLCLWERQRTTALDTKAAALTNLSSLAAAVVAATSVAGLSDAGQAPAPIARFVSVGLFVITVLLSLNTQRVALLGGFLDIDVFEALASHASPVGGTPPFTDKDPYRCLLRETALQRWLVYRRNCDQNDAKYRRLRWAQLGAALAVVSLIPVLVRALP